MKVVIAIDSLKGSLSSIEAGNAAADGVRAAMPDAMVVVKPLADGGEGTTDALIEGMSVLWMDRRAADGSDGNGCCSRDYAVAGWQGRSDEGEYTRRW